MSGTRTDGRTPDALRRHYEVERELADRLRRAPPSERPRLYKTVYSELFARVPDHPQNVWKETPEQQAARTAEQLRLIRPFLNPGAVYLEVGAGDCHLARTIARQVKVAYAVDVADLLGPGADRPANFELRLTDGTALPVEDDRVTVAFSNMLVEHLHPDDLTLHLREVHRVLVPGGVYVCRTPHRYTGPQDISQFFGQTPTGFHLKEYSFRELADLFSAAGFRSVRARPSVKRRSFPLPGWAMRSAEAALGLLPYRARHRACGSAVLRPLFGVITAVGRKGTRAAVQSPLRPAPEPGSLS